MKICHINLAKGYRGGERQTEMLIKALSDLGITQKLVARHDSPLIKKLETEAEWDFMPYEKLPLEKNSPSVAGGPAS